MLTHQTRTITCSVSFLFAMTFQTLVACAEVPVGNVTLQGDREISDRLTVRVLNNASVIDLNAADKGNVHSLAIKLYAIPIAGSC